MLKNYFFNRIYEHLIFQPTQDQKNLIEYLSDFIFSDDKNLFILRGYAGTGKTLIISALVKVLEECNVETVLMAPTGRAAKVFSNFAERPAYTIHKIIYRQKSSKDLFSKFELNKNLHSNNCIYIVDEASMLSNESKEQSIFGSGKLIDDLVSYVYSKKSSKLILVGDNAQLPPIGFDESPALDVNYMKSYNLEIIDFTIKQIVRQKLDTLLLENATNIRNMIEKKELKFPVIGLKNDVKNISINETIDEIDNCYSKYGIYDTLVINRSNKKANKYNNAIRNQIFGKEGDIEKGDILMIVRNNYFWLNENQNISFLANGDIAEVLKIKKWHEKDEYRFADVILHLIDYNETIESRIMLNTLMLDTPSLPEANNKDFFYKILKDYENIKPKRKAYELVKKDNFFNALQVKYAYSLTCHKSQGGQWKAVFIDIGYIKEENIDLSFLRWLYTAITRAQEEVFFINYPSSFTIEY